MIYALKFNEIPVGHPGTVVAFFWKTSQELRLHSQVNKNSGDMF
jgi:hypothetical protein